ncbi:MAG: hemerythrin family protein [Candidatus Scalindua sp.]|jgi:hemerythrin|nr:hemerythrin family protein [Candidatus Scalindua sp.]MBT6045670.1 hemerythrin family protein [Candidatus Scalindua sp.]MBT6225843.1 hemerythrin family protein [Candidatus Scalindua sp.]MBT6561660.1 hemerythrin family protein [Candidatus Scalindua sp.]MBT7210247.1 hemerythrin family protein [Candidatus Scalindua sp.]
MIKQKDKFRRYASLIRKEQKKLIGTVDKAIVAKQDQDRPKELEKVLSNITKDAIRYFSTEETYMIDFKYPRYQYHKEEHQDFSTKTHAYCKRILNSDYQTAHEILEYLKQWLIKHFQETDKKYTEYFNKSKLRQFYD